MFISKSVKKAETLLIFLEIELRISLLLRVIALIGWEKRQRSEENIFTTYNGGL